MTFQTCLKALVIILLVLKYTCSYAQREHVSSEKMRFLISDAQYLNSLDGTITPNISTGFRPFRYSWSGPNGFYSQDSILQNVGPGSYHLDLEDALCGTFSDVFVVRSVSNELESFTGIKIQSVTPNPFQNRISLSMRSDNDEVCHVRLIDSNAKSVVNDKIYLEQGIQSIEITDISAAPGLYILQICVHDRCVLSERLLKVD